MRTKMSVLITINGEIDSKELFADIQQYGANVTDVGTKTMVYCEIDIRNDAIEKIMTACHKYGDCEVSAHMLKEKE